MGFAVLILLALAFYFFLNSRSQALLLIAISLLFYLYGLRADNLIFLLHVFAVYFALKARKHIPKENAYTLAYKLSVFIFALAPLLISKYGYLFGLKTQDFAPLGISFITFAMIGYVADSFRKPVTDRSENFNEYALINFFFPHVTSGPIARKSMLGPQISEKKKFVPSVFDEGLFFILLGIFQKFALANRISLFTDNVFSTPAASLGFPLLISVYLFSFQLYFDFLGYSNIAVGIARLFGYDLILNFKRPYLALSVGDFWRRWHISLSNWLRDYVYIGLGGNRKGILRKIFNILVTFGVSGIWHGSTPLFIVWGLIHGFLVAAEGVVSNLKEKVGKKYRFPKLFRILLTFNAVTLLWTFFKARSYEEFIFIMANLFKGQNYSTGIKTILENRDSLINLEIAFVLIVFWFTTEILSEYNKEFSQRLIKSKSAKVFMYTTLIVLTLFLGVFGLQNFYYVRF